MVVRIQAGEGQHSTCCTAMRPTPSVPSALEAPQGSMKQKSFRGALSVSEHFVTTMFVRRMATTISADEGEHKKFKQCKVCLNCFYQTNYNDETIHARLRR